MKTELNELNLLQGIENMTETNSLSLKESVIWYTLSIHYYFFKIMKSGFGFDNLYSKQINTKLFCFISYCAGKHGSHVSILDKAGFDNHLFLLFIFLRPPFWISQHHYFGYPVISHKSNSAS